MYKDYIKQRNLHNYLSDEELARWQAGKITETVLMEIIKQVGKLNGKEDVMLYLITMLDENGKEIEEMERLARENKAWEDSVMNPDGKIDGKIIDELVDEMGNGKNNN